MVLATLASCGKDNKVASPNPAAPAVATSPSTVANSAVLASAAAQALLAKINAPTTGFGTGTLYLNNAVTQTCKEKWIFTYCTSSSSGTNKTATTWNAVAASRDLTYQYLNLNGSFSRSVLHSGIAVETKRTELTNLLNSATAIYGSGTIFVITVAGGQYTVDTSYPIQANPIRTVNDYFIQAI